ncbi:MAG: hypothetical protein Q9207_002514 [Kuettlingeria erythrocarpa]
MQVVSQQLDFRSIGYEAIDPEAQESLAVVKRITLDLAITIGTHLTALGIMYEENGEMLLPQGNTIKITSVHDVFQFNNRDRAKVSRAGCIDSTLEPGENFIIRSVVELHVKFVESSGPAVNAVVVVEHQNLAGLLTRHPHAFSDGMVVMIYYSSGATKEFLNLLYNDARLKDKPFLYFADHNMQGISIFQTLKYSSKNSARLGKKKGAQDKDQVRAEDAQRPGNVYRLPKKWFSRTRGAGQARG